MGRIICLSGAAGHGKSTLLSLLYRSKVHNVAITLVAPSLSRVLEILRNLKRGETLIIDECSPEVLDVIKGTHYDGFVVVALMA